ncbi:19826_t:CDS:1, partial [Rhizophagus irregularis]
MAITDESVIFNKISSKCDDLLEILNEIFLNILTRNVENIEESLSLYKD